MEKEERIRQLITEIQLDIAGGREWACWPVDGCGNHGCRVTPPKKGQATNGRCDCMRYVPLKIRPKLEKALRQI